VPGKPAPASSRVERRGRKALVPLSPPGTLDAAGIPVGTVAGLFEAWLQSRQATSRIASQRTIAGYRDDMARWATLLATGGPGPAWDRLALEHLNPAGIHAALAAMAAAGLSVPARQRAMAPLRGLCAWLARHGHLPFDPTADEDLSVKSRPQRLPAPYNTEELGRIAAAVERGFDDQNAQLRWPERDQAVVALLAGAGLKISELCALRWERLAELDTAAPVLRVRGKGGRKRAIPLSPVAAEMLRRYRTDRQQRAATTDKLAVRAQARVIVQTDGRPVTPTTVNAWIERWLRHAAVPRRPGALAHAFRHTAADGWLDTGATVAEVQALLGHASVATTGIYIKARPASLADVTRAGRYELSRSGQKRKADDTRSR
jgi:site-specific recombinase XerD